MVFVIYSIALQSQTLQVDISKTVLRAIAPSSYQQILKTDREISEIFRSEDIRPPKILREKKHTHGVEEL